MSLQARGALRRAKSLDAREPLRKAAIPLRAAAPAMSRVPCACLPLALALVARASAQSTWIEQPAIPATDPLVSAYDVSRDRIVVFTQSPSAPLAETWEWDGRAWTRQAIGGPQPLFSTRLAYSPGDQSPLLFGGDSPPTGSDQQWLWLGDHWQSLAGQPTPPGRSRQAMAADPVRSSLVMFGGVTGFGSSTTMLGDTWERTATGWHSLQPATSPPARADAAMAFDPSTGKLLLFGGWTISSSLQLFRDTWSWDGTQWTQVASTGPVYETGVSMVGDLNRRRVVLLTPRGETWEWNGSQWSQAASGQSPPPHVTLAYDEKRGQTVAFGNQGGASATSTWRWTGTTWLAFPDGDAPGQGQSSFMAEDEVHGNVVLLEATSKQTATFDGLQWTCQPVTPSGAGGAAMAGDRNGVVLLGGFGATFEWDGTSWAKVPVAGVPGTLFGISMAYDDVRKETVLLESHADPSSTATWEWDGSRWQPRAPAAASPTAAPFPSGLYRLAFDRQRQRTVAYAGDGQAPDTWEWDGSSWTHIVPLTSPPLRTGFSMAYSPDLRRVIVHGGRSPAATYPNGRYDDTWSWDGSRWSPVPTTGHAPALEGALAAAHSATGHVVLFGGQSTTDASATWLLGRGPKATATQRTAGCLVLVLSPFGRPALGNGSFALDLQYPYANAMVGALVGLPATLPFGRCTLGVDPSTAVALPSRTNGYDFASIPLPIPAMPVVLGATFGVQAAAPNPVYVPSIDLSPAWAVQVGY